jgi:hypothetical protein
LESKKCHRASIAMQQLVNTYFCGKEYGHNSRGTAGGGIS